MSDMIRVVEAEWTGSGSHLCSGEWILRVNGHNVSNRIPAALKHVPMGTYKTYDSWSFSDDHKKVWKSYNDGLHMDEWIIKNKFWLNRITPDLLIQRKIFIAINEEDWRYGSCGGCI